MILSGCATFIWAIARLHGVRETPPRSIHLIDSWTSDGVCALYCVGDTTKGSLLLWSQQAAINYADMLDICLHAILITASRRFDGDWHPELLANIFHYRLDYRRRHNVAGAHEIYNGRRLRSFEHIH
ncbi:hypothetical protein CBL_00837 [Carabus blaptoides fortunei]